MRPEDHPEFFRLPPPPGQSRESSIRLDEQGRFWHAGELVTHPGMQAAFSTWIRRHPEDGRYILCNGYDWSYFSVDDVPYLVRGLAERPGQPAGVQLELSDGSSEALVPGSLRLGPRDALYCQVKAGAFEARFTPGAQAGLMPYLVEGPRGEVLLELGGERFPIT